MRDIDETIDVSGSRVLPIVLTATACTWRDSRWSLTKVDNYILWFIMAIEYNIGEIYFLWQGKWLRVEIEKWQ